MVNLKVGELKKHLKQLERDELIALIVELSKTSKEAKNYLAAEVQGEEAVVELFEEAREAVISEFFPAKGMPKMRLVAAKKAINDFKKTTGDHPKTADLMLCYVEAGTEFTRTYGDIDGPFYSSMATMFANIAKECEKDVEIYLDLSERMENVLRMAEGVGWGYLDMLIDSYYCIPWADEDKDEEDK